MSFIEILDSDEEPAPAVASQVKSGSKITTPAKQRSVPLSTRDEPIVIDDSDEDDLEPPGASISSKPRSKHMGDLQLIG